MTQILEEQIPPMSEREIRHAALAKQAAAEGIVLLENDGTLPLMANEKVALYGEGVTNTIAWGDSLAKMHSRYVKNIEEGLAEHGFLVMEHDRIDPETKTAIFVLSRQSSEGRDRELVAGDYLMTEEEELILSQITAIYPKVIVVLNVGGIVDLSFLEKYHISALLLMGYGGMEGGSALASVLSGEINPSGRLTDSWAYQYEDYPCNEKTLRKAHNRYEKYYTEGIYVGYRYFDTFGVKVRYPFGYGLSYTTFSYEAARIAEKNGMVSVKMTVKNTGDRAGADVIQLYVSKPWGLRRKELKQLVGFQKTRVLEAGETEQFVIEFPLYAIAAWHTGESCYIYDKGSCMMLAGHSCMDVKTIGILHFSDVFRMEKLNNICPLQDALREITPPEDIHQKMRSRWRKEAAGHPNIEITETKMADLFENTNELLDWDDLSVDDFQLAPLHLRRMTMDEKIHTVVGQMKMPGEEFMSYTAEIAPGAAGETTHQLQANLQIDPAAFADGPSGLCLTPSYQRGENDEICYQFTTAFPSGTVLAQSFNAKLWRQIGKAIAVEMREFNVKLWLAPAMNVHRDPLCGRNFEYYSEDPILSGICAAQITKGVQKDRGLGTTIRQFACNNQENYSREYSSIISERALREIYLKGFEICIRESQPKAMMTAYNKINGIHCANNYDLCTEVLRNEWEFEGVVMTDWNTTNDGGGCSAAKCIAAGNDLVMPGRVSDLIEVKEAMEGNGNFMLSEDQLNASTLRILTLLLMQ